MPAPDLAPLGAQGRVSELARGPHLCPRCLPVGNGVAQVSELVVDQRGELLPR